MQVEGSIETNQLELIYREIFLLLFWGYVKPIRSLKGSVFFRGLANVQDCWV